MPFLRKYQKYPLPRQGASGNLLLTTPIPLPLAIVPNWDYIVPMRIIALSRLKAFWETPAHSDAKESFLEWHRFVLNADWASPADIKADLRNASILQDGRVVFNVAGNEYRLVVWINYPYRVVYIRFAGTHRQYDAIDPQTI
jgi:mRNA interferase HigB